MIILKVIIFPKERQKFSFLTSFSFLPKTDEKWPFLPKTDEK